MAGQLSGLTMEWRLYPLMAERGIRTAAELGRRLRAAGVQISEAHAGRLVNQAPKRISSELLVGLIHVLDCELGELWRRKKEKEK